jgi:hypothetical protein
MSKLNPEILKILIKRTGKKEATVRKDISLLRRKYAKLSINAVAQIYASQNGFSILRKLDKEDREKMPFFEIEKPIEIKRATKTKRKNKKHVQFIHYPILDTFRKAHVDEVNRAYGYECHTSAFIMCRKIIENLLIDILRLKFPPKTRKNKELYFDIQQGRFKDFSDILESLKNTKSQFEVDKKIVEKIISLSEPFKEEANDKTHSWYHIVKYKKEIDDIHVQDILDLIAKLEENLIRETNIKIRG